MTILAAVVLAACGRFEWAFFFALGATLESLEIWYARPCHVCGYFKWRPCEHRRATKGMIP